MQNTSIAISLQKIHLKIKITIKNLSARNCQAAKQLIFNSVSFRCKRAGDFMSKINFENISLFAAVYFNIIMIQFPKLYVITAK